MFGAAPKHVLFMQDAVLPVNVEFMDMCTMSDKAVPLVGLLNSQKLKRFATRELCSYFLCIPTQVHCPAYILRYDSPDVIDNSIIDCHRQARRQLSKDSTCEVLFASVGGINQQNFP